LFTLRLFRMTANTYGDVAVVSPLDVQTGAQQITAMILRPAGLYALLLSIGIVSGCRGNERGGADSARALPPVFPSGPANTGWNPEAGPMMIVSSGNSDTVGVVLPEATDSTIEVLQTITPPVAGLAFDLFDRAGRTASWVGVSPLVETDTTQECDTWPMARLRARSARGNWRVGFVAGRVQPVPLDSIEALNSADSSALAVSLARAAATVAGVSDPTFKGLPFRVRSAYTFRRDTVDVVVGDVVRSVNEEANPRVEHLLIVGERPHGSNANFNVAYYSRTAGPEEATQATEILAVVEIGPAKRPAIVINIEYDDGGKLGLIERISEGEWRPTWKSAYTDC
jgi:hypothetical protein